MAAPFLPAALRPPAEERIPSGEEGSNAGRASSPEDLLTVYVAREPLPALAQVGSIGEEVCCLLLLSSFSVFVVAKSSKREELTVHIHSNSLHGLEVNLGGKKMYLVLVFLQKMYHRMRLHSWIAMCLFILTRCST